MSKNMDLSIIMKLLDLFSDVYLIVKFYQLIKFKLRVDHIFRNFEAGRYTTKCFTGRTEKSDRRGERRERTNHTERPCTLREDPDEGDAEQGRGDVGGEAVQGAV